MEKITGYLRCVPLEGWIFACAMGWMAFALWISEPWEVTAESALWASILTASVAVAVRYPFLGSVFFLLSFVMALYLPYSFLECDVFLCAVMTGVVSYHGRGRLMLSVGVSVGVLALIDRDTKTIEADFSAVLIWATIMALTAFAGWTLGHKVRQKNELAEQWRDEYRRRRENLASTLHDSVAASLTSIVMRSEVLAMKEPEGGHLHEELAGIAEDARITMSQVRSLLSLLNAPQDKHEKRAAPALVATLKEVATKMRDHHFTVSVVDETADIQLTNPTLELLHKVLLEGATNVIKYAKPRSEVRIHAEGDGKNLGVSLSNQIAAEEERRGWLSSSVLSSGLGMRMMRRSVTSMGGKLSSHSDGKTWTLSIKF